MVLRIRGRENIIAIDQLAVRRGDQQRRHAFQPSGDAEASGNLLVTVEAADIHGNYFIMRGHEALHFRQFEEIGQHDAVHAPVAAQVNQYPLVGFSGAVEGGRDGRIGIGMFVIGLHQHHRQLLQGCDGRLWRRHRCERRCGEQEDGKCEPLHAAGLSRPRPSSRASIWGSRPRNAR